jgi:hypothetical protein
MKKQIARLPKDLKGDDENCSVCGDDNVVMVIQGETNCCYCGNQVNLCSKCCGQMKREIAVLNVGV